MIHSSFFQEKWYISELCSNGSMHMYIQLGCLNIQALLTPIALLVKKISINDTGNCLSTVAILYWLSVPRLCNEHLKKKCYNKYFPSIKLRISNRKKTNQIKKNLCEWPEKTFCCLFLLWKSLICPLLFDK